MRKIAPTIAICLATIGCEVRQDATRPPQPAKTARVKTEVTIPEDISYSILQRRQFTEDRRLDVTINKRVSEDVLRSIATSAKGKEQGSYRNLTIFFRIRGEEDPMLTAWARVDFDPDLKVRIIGITAEQEKLLKDVPKDTNRQVVGSWMDLTFKCRITIFRRDGKAFADKAYIDGSGRTDELIEKETPAGTRFDMKDLQVHWLLDRSGNLQDQNSQGETFSTHKKVP